MRLPRNAHDPIPCGFSRDRIFSEAATFASGIGFAVGTPAVSLLAKMGGKTSIMNGLADVVIGSMPSEDSDCLVVYGERDFLVLLKPSDNPDLARANLEVAKAIGHYVLHSPKVREKHGADAGLIVRHYPKTSQEELCQREAVQFAFGLLAPLDRLKAEWEHTGGDLKKLREMFRMPLELLEALYQECAVPTA
ncbi:ImmA/IrrE family metallo-endopeptidase [Microvirga sp. BT688]|uniref:ImmA/IrrE family metallo-endopeptidase n=1 Tax=Microvirga sp. TaxID=1873136 RepID=UPI001685DC1E|nr:ImmA/IrrE family metallo-endopeptidase [Microvirga sp.]MBD2745898.1 ImmA/IrrE family metallo-endopeptidase [Microvirga sp.]